MSEMNIAFFEALGYEIGQALARNLPHAHPPAKAAAPARRKARKAVRKTARKAARKAARRKSAPTRGSGKGRFGVGDHVLYRQGRGTFPGVVIRVSADGRCVVMRDQDGKRVLRPPSKLKRA
jgi:sRNA-binding protein